MHWIINGLAFVGAISLTAMAIFIWACWHDVTQQQATARQTKPNSTPWRHSPRNTNGASSGRHPVTLLVVPGGRCRGWASCCGHDVLPLSVDDPGGESHLRQPGAGDR